jgi:hypothetical protein
VLPTLTVVVAGKAMPEIAILLGLLLLVPVPPGLYVADFFEQERNSNDIEHAITIAKCFVFMI